MAMTLFLRHIPDPPEVGLKELEEPQKQRGLAPLLVVPRDETGRKKVKFDRAWDMFIVLVYRLLRDSRVLLVREREKTITVNSHWVLPRFKAMRRRFWKRNGKDLVSGSLQKPMEISCS